MTGPRALLAHAFVFELVHAYVYGMGLSGVPFVGGLVLGRAFQRTRSLAVPTLLHAGHNVLVFVWLWLARCGPTTTRVVEGHRPALIRAPAYSAHG